MKLVLVGISHHRTPIELREQVALSTGQAAALSGELAGVAGEAVCLSTCNRTELYVVGEDAESHALAALAAETHAHAYRLSDEAAALHLFRVAAGLDSLVPGEGEILGQVRGAYEAGAAGPLLDRLFRQALHAGKKVRSQTAISESPASVSAAAAALAQQVFGDLSGHRILIVGAGKVSEQAARNLISRGASIGFVANRTVDHGAELAARVGAEALPLERIGEELVRADVVVSSTSAPGFVITSADVAAALPARKGRPLLLIDLAVPRDLEPAIHALDDCYLYDIDDLESVVDRDDGRASRRGRARRGDRARGGRGVSRLAGVARRRPGDRVAARPGRGDPFARAPEGAHAPVRERARGGRVDHLAGSQQAPAPADGADEGGGRGVRRAGLC